jgi:hypothetical protein
MTSCAKSTTSKSLTGPPRRRPPRPVRPAAAAAAAVGVQQPAAAAARAARARRKTAASCKAKAASVSCVARGAGACFSSSSSSSSPSASNCIGALAAKGMAHGGECVVGGSVTFSPAWPPSPSSFAGRGPSAPPPPPPPLRPPISPSCTHTRTHARTHAHLHARTFACMSVCILLCVRVYVCLPAFSAARFLAASSRSRRTCSSRLRSALAWSVLPAACRRQYSAFFRSASCASLPAIESVGRG